jgi:hypothetical protein
MVTAFLPTFPIRADLALVKGDAYAKAIGLITAAGLVNTAGWYGLLQVWDPDGVLIAESSTANGRITVGIQGTAPNQWNVLVEVPAIVTAALTDWGIGEWQVQLGPASTSAVTYFGGKAWLIPDRAF